LENQVLILKMKVMYKYILYSILMASLLASCGNLEQTVTPDLQQVNPTVVIEGLISNNESNLQTVKLSQSTGYYNTGETQKISHAMVTVEDDLGNFYEFAHSEATPGLYTANFAGQVGITYDLTVIANDLVYEASETMYRVTSFDSLTWIIDEEEKADLENDNDTSGEYYDVLMYVQEPPETEDFYRFKFFTNGDEDTDDYQEVYYSDDVLLSDAIEGLESVRFYALNDSVTIETYSISRQAFLFFSDMQTLLNNDGGIYGPIPANLRNNISNGALGYFQVSAMESASIVVGE
jgi:hypothetical protein